MIVTTANPCAERSPRADPRREGPIAQGLRIQIVDDDADTVDSMACVLKLWGHAVRCDYSGAAALVSARIFRPDVALLDIAMPGLDGFILAMCYRQHSFLNRTALAAVSGYSDSATQERAAEAGFDRYFVKPLVFHELAAFLDSQMATGWAASVQPSKRALHV